MITQKASNEIMRALIESDDLGSFHAKVTAIMGVIGDPCEKIMAGFIAAAMKEAGRLIEVTVND